MFILSDCKTTKLDLIVSFLGSGKIFDSEFTAQVDFVTKLIDKFVIGPNNTQVGIYSFTANVANASKIRLDDFENKTELLNGIYSVQRDRDLTVYWHSIRSIARQGFSSAYGARKHVHRVFIAFMKNESIDEAIEDIYDSEVKKLSNMTAITIGVTSNSPPGFKQMRNIASNDSLVFALNDFSELPTIMDNIIRIICEEKRQQRK